MHAHPLVDVGRLSRDASVFGMLALSSRRFGSNELANSQPPLDHEPPRSARRREGGSTSTFVRAAAHRHRCRGAGSTMEAVVKSVQQSTHAVLSRRRVVVAGAAGMLSLATLTAGGASPCGDTCHALDTHHRNGCEVAMPSSTESAASVESCIRGPSSIAECHARRPARGTPPLLFHGGKVMGTRSTVNCRHPHLLEPVGHTMTSSYKSLITTYRKMSRRRAGSTATSSTLPQYFGSNGRIRNQIRLATPIKTPRRCRPAPAKWRQ